MKLTDEQCETLQHAANKLRTVWANHTGDKESRELCHKLEAILAANPVAATAVAQSDEQFEVIDVENYRLRRAMQKVMARLTDLLDEDQFANIESIVSEVGVEPPVATSGPKPVYQARARGIEEQWSDVNHNGFLAALAMWSMEARILYTAPSAPARGIEELRNVIRCLRETGVYRDEEGEATDALESLLMLDAAPTPTVAADAGAPSEDAYVAQRMTEALADVYATIVGDDPQRDDDSLNAIERVKKAAQVLRLEVDLYRSQRDAVDAQPDQFAQSRNMVAQSDERAAFEELSNIANAKRFDRETFSDDTEFADWAQNRARHTLARVTAAQATTATSGRISLPALIDASEAAWAEKARTDRGGSDAD